MTSPHQRELQRIAVGLLSMPAAARYGAVTHLDAEDRDYVMQLSVDVSRACRTLAALVDCSYEQAVAAVAGLQECSAGIADFLARGTQRPSCT